MWKSMWISGWKTPNINFTDFPPIGVDNFQAKNPCPARACAIFHIFHHPYYYNIYLNLTFLSFSESSQRGKLRHATAPET